MKRQFDEDRLAKLATPKVQSKPESKADTGRGASGREDGDDKVKEIADKVHRGKPMDFMSYLDKDVPAIDHKIKKKIDKGEVEVGQLTGK